MSSIECAIDVDAINHDAVLPDLQQQNEDEQLSRLSEQFRCEICPYRTYLEDKMRIHQSRHDRSNMGVEQQLHKCKFCPYFVKSRRAVAKHEELHRSKEIFLSSLELAESGDVFELKRQKYTCSKCPFVSNKRALFDSHREFHRKEKMGDKKCEYCSFWCSGETEMEVHKKLHDFAYLSQMRSQRNKFSSPSGVDESQYNMTQTKLKHEIISSRIKSVQVTPSKVIPPPVKDRGDELEPTYILQRSCQNLTTTFYKKRYTCKFCPWTGPRQSTLQLHEKMHGEGARTAKSYGCQFCDYFSTSMYLLSEHIRVHSLSYQPGVHIINDVETTVEDTRMDEEFSHSDDEEVTVDVNAKSGPNAQLYRPLPKPEDMEPELEEGVLFDVEEEETQRRSE